MYASGLSKGDWVLHVNKVLGYFLSENSPEELIELIGKRKLVDFILDEYKKIK